MTVVQLQRTWELGEQIGGGGFGQVFRASSGGEFAALKLVPKDAGAEREMLFVDLDSAENVVPILDSGGTDEAWAIVMPLAERTLREALEDAGRFSVEEGRAIAEDVLTALASLDGSVVHRDLKPENVLLHDGAWCLADFGISRYAEATTATDTQKYAMSDPYAAPERWRAERATSAADIYSFGVMLYELLVGELPFPGPTREDYREQHLHQDPPEPPDLPDPIATLLRECMYRSPSARPSAANALERIRRMDSAGSSEGLSALEAANRVVVADRSARDQAASRARSAAEVRQALLDDATLAIQRIGERLRSMISEAAPAATVDVPRPTNWSLSLQDAEFSLVGPSPAGDSQVEPFDVVSSAIISLTIPPGHDGFQGRSHSLWFCDAQVKGEYRWFETAFKVATLMPEQGVLEPFALDPGNEEVRQAIFSGMGTRDVAWPFTSLEADDLSEFLDRWASWVAAAVTGKLAREPNAAPGAAHSWRNN